MQQGDEAQIALLAQQAVDALAGFDDGADHSERYYLHKVMRAIDLSRMLSAAMQQLRREGELTELELMLARNEFAEMLEQFRRRLAAEIAARMSTAGMHHADVDIGSGLADRDMLQLSALELTRTSPSGAAACQTVGSADQQPSPSAQHRSARPAPHRATFAAGGWRPAGCRDAASPSAPTRPRPAVRRQRIGGRVRPVHLHAGACAAR